MALCGSTTAGLVAQGEAPGGNIDSVEQWDGSSWTEVADCNTTRNQPGGGGTSTASICFGGDPSALTENWDGSSWTEVGDMSTARGRAAAAGTSTAAFCAAGATPGATTGVNNTEEWDWSSTRAAGAWASGGNVNTGRHAISGAGTLTAGVIFGDTADTEL